MSVQYVTDATGDTTAVIVPIAEWEVILRKLNEDEPERNDTAYLLQSETMKKRLLKARNRSGGRTWKEVRDALDL